jgi:hypothetical protein
MASNVRTLLGSAFLTVTANPGSSSPPTGGGSIELDIGTVKLTAPHAVGSGLFNVQDLTLLLNQGITPNQITVETPGGLYGNSIGVYTFTSISGGIISGCSLTVGTDAAFPVGSTVSIQYSTSTGGGGTGTPGGTTGQFQTNAGGGNFGGVSSTGTGNVVLATSPTLVTPALGTPASGNLANCTFPTLNQNTAGNAATASAVAASGVTGTPAGMLKGSSGAIVAATSDTDYQAPISLTTTGSSGAATFSGNTLNIPQYTGGGGGSGTVNSGTAGQAAYYAASGTAVSGAAAFGIGASGQRVDSAIALPSLVAGMAYYDSTRLAEASYRNANVGYTSRVLYRQIAIAGPFTASGASSALVTTGGIGGAIITGTNQLTLPANWFVVGKGLRIIIGGYGTTGATPGNISYAVLLGGNVVATTLAGAPAGNELLTTGGLISVIVDLVCKATGGGTSALLDSNGQCRVLGSSTGIGNGSVFGTPSFGTQIGFNSTVTLTLDFQVTMATGAVNSVSFNNFTVEEIG